MLLAVEPDLFVINTIILPEPEILVAMATDTKIDTSAKTNNDAKIDTDTKTNINMYPFNSILNCYYDILISNISCY